jgi:hypothetical protein
VSLSYGTGVTSSLAPVASSKGLLRYWKDRALGWLARILRVTPSRSGLAVGSRAAEAEEPQAVRRGPAAVRAAAPAVARRSVLRDSGDEADMGWFSWLLTCRG